MSLSRREFVQFAGAGLLLKSQLLQGQQAPAQVPLAPRQSPMVAGALVVPPSIGISKVALVQGDDRRKNVYNALMSIDDQVKAGLKRKKYVVIKPNIVTTKNQLGATNADALRGILDYLEPRFRGPVIIAESSAADTLEGFENFKYNQVAAEHSSQKVSLVDLNREGKYEIHSILDYNLHAIPVRLAARLVDPDAFVISAAMLKTHNTVVTTQSVKNMVMGSPLHNAPGETPWNDKRRFHAGVRQIHINMLLTVQRLRPNWGVAVIDGYEGMQGSGPSSGTPVASHIAIASTDFIAADRVGIEAMGINPDWVGYLNFCAQAGLGQYDLSQIEVIGPTPASVQKKYELHPDIQRELQWMGPMTDLPPTLGSLHQQQLDLNHQLDLIYG